jgi:hypothetical protein
MSPIINEKLFVFAAEHLRDVVRTRDPPLGFKSGEAVGLKDLIARGIVLVWLMGKFDVSLLACLVNINPIDSHRLFNQFMDGKRTAENTLGVCVEMSMACGHDPTALEWTTTSMLLDEAWEIQNCVSIWNDV